MAPAAARYAAFLARSLRSATARQAAMVMAGNIVSAAFRFGVTAILANTLSPADWGYLVVYVALMDLVAILCDSGLQSAQVRFLAIEADRSPERVVRLGLNVKTALSAVFLLCGLAFSSAFLRWQGIPDAYHWLYPVTLAAALALSYGYVVLAILQAAGRYSWFAVQTFLANALRFVVTAGLVWAGIRGFVPLATVFFAALLPAMLYGIAVARAALRPAWTLPPSEVTSRRFLRFLAPLAAMNIILIVLLRADVFMLKAMCDVEAVANYGLAYQVGFCFPLLARALFAVLLPKVSAMTASKQLILYRRKVLATYPAVLAATLIGAWLGPFVLLLFFGDKYAAALSVIRLLILGFGVEIVLNPLSLIFYALDRPHAMTVVHAAQLAFVVSMNALWLIPSYDEAGPALALLIVRIAAVIAVVLWTGRLLRRRSLSEAAQASAQRDNMPDPPG